MMKRQFLKNSWTLALSASLGLAWLAAANSYGDEKPVAQPGERATKAEKIKATPTKFRGRLPAYYGKIVTPEQRKEIYAIQAKYHEQIEDLQFQLAEAIEQRDAEVAGVLKPDQRNKLVQIISQAKAEHRKRSDRQAKKPGSDKEKK